MAGDYGFTGADIASISNAREGLVQGFMQLGKQIESDITRIATVREMKSFGQELANLDPTNEAFPQQLIGTLAKYPLASNTEIAKRGIEVLGTRYRAAQQAKVTANKATNWTDLGGGVYHVPGTGTFSYDEAGNPKFIDTTPNDRGPLRGTVVQTPDKQILINPATGETIQEFAPKPSTRSRENMPDVLKFHLRALDDSEKRITTERQKLLDGIHNGTIGENDRAKAYEDVAGLEGDLKSVQAQREKIYQQAEEARSTAPAMPTGAGQGVNGAAIMPGPPTPDIPPFVPKAMPTDIATPQMTLNQPGNSVLPDNLPVLPGVVPPAKQAGTPRMYTMKNRHFDLVSGASPKAAIDQAWNDQVLTDEERSALYRHYSLQ